MRKGQVQIHSENILPIITQWLYSEKDIFLRELVANACDACTKTIHLKEKGLFTEETTSHAIRVHVDNDAKTITFSDTGIGLDAEEAEKYLSQVAFSGATEFVSSYNIEDPFIGHFGLGFYSAFMVASRVVVESKSYKEDAPAITWSSDGSSSYEITEGTKTTRGTDVILHINEENKEFLEEATVISILKRYCSFLPFPIFVGETAINKDEPLWLKKPSECTEEEYIQFYKTLYPFQEAPLFWVHLNVDYPFHLKGIIYFPKIKKDIDFQKNNMRLFCNRVFVSDDCKDILPEYLTVLQGAIESPDIPLNVSRSYLQVDKTVRSLGSHISKKVCDALRALYNTNREKFIQCWQESNFIIKLAVIQDQAFYEKAKSFLAWQTVDGEWVTVEEYLDKNKEKTNNTVFYAISRDHAQNLLSIYKEKGIDVLIAESPLDNAVISHLEAKIENVQFKRIDSDADDVFIDPTKEKTVLDQDGQTEATKIALFFEALLGENVQVEAKSLASSDVAAFLKIGENERRMREYAVQFQDMFPFGGKDLAKSTFIVNTNSDMVTNIYNVGKINEELAKDMAQHLYDLTLLSQKEMDPNLFSHFLKRSSHFLHSVAKEVVKK